MMIDPRIAQEIVTRIMRIIPHNINVMDARGIIIASGTPARVGTLHTGAQAALARRQPMEIGDDAAGRASGMRPGINLLLYGRGEVCGVVGITGDPQEIRHFAELVRVTAEMIIEQALLTGELQRQLRYREEFVFQLLRRTGESAANLQAWAARLNFDPATPHMVVVLVPQDQAAPHAQLAALQAVQAALLAWRPGLLVTVTAPQELALIEPLDVSGTRAQCLARTTARLAALDEIVAPLLPAGHALSAGVGLAGLEEMAVSYWTAQEALAIARAREKAGRRVSYYELSLPVLLADLDQGWKREQLRGPIDLLAAADPKGGVLRKTLAAWLANERNAAQTAQALHVHRNTLNYRLRRIHEVTGLDLDDIDDLLLLYVGLALSGAGPDGR
ncbi:MAG: Carbohydrate diacid regulator [Paracidovorax wautersii]|uniref:Carbohydrate diacid regulator n=1 Tax=Paracidovorax wautersii TaxID=1177982 RepID=A0A7V8FP97_9BURK|nr:MAG: Carbohydrate diacid regulator [Paracidovorax wautersii]